MDRSEPHSWTASETLTALRAGDISAVELLEHQLARQARLDGEINAVVEVNPEAALEAARAADARRAAGADASCPLNGLPMTIKDTYEVEGFHATAGIPELAQYRAPRDAAAVALLRKAGAVIYGKTNVPVAASDHQSYNPIYGLTRNPWNPQRTVGGSSGGSAAALAAGFTALELGSDIGGSIRIPSHYCGVWGHKPSYGIVPGQGHIPPMPGALAPAPLAVCGPLARSAADLELALDLLTAAPQGAWQLQLPAPRHKSLSQFRVAVLTEGFPVDPAYAAALQSFGQALAREGAQVTQLSAPPAHMEGSAALYIDMLFAVIGGGMPEPELQAFDAAAATHPEGSLARQVASAVRASMADFAGLAERQAHLIAAWGDWFRDYDVLLCPVAMGTAFAHQIEDGHGPAPQMNRVLEVGGQSRPYMENLYWPGLATLAHLPATVRPLPELLNGLPAGVQIIGPLQEDRTPLAFTKLCDAAFGGFRSPTLPD
ncbi:amidase [Phaeobacter sp. HF9A]|uniref:amidase n=1 Tax=Phaeobacter sp. HF9A TaxID=2721561 RepID=UPI0014321D94|nr:amidase [Phaeobacter sp. HF9A]NIZ12336.1 amidase [Phaeobacter sp. HF9A]